MLYTLQKRWIPDIVRGNHLMDTVKFFYVVNNHFNNALINEPMPVGTAAENAFIIRHQESVNRYFYFMNSLVIT